MDEIKKIARSRYRNDCGEPFELTDGQAEIFETIARRAYPRVHCLSYSQYGKSDTVAMAVLTRITAFPEKWAIVAPSNKKARIIMGKVIQHTFDNEFTMAMFEPSEGESVERIMRERSKDRMTYRHKDRRIGEVFTLSSEGKRTKDLLDALMGFGAPNVIIDESSLVDDIQYVGILRMLGGHKDNFLFEIGNSMRRNHFHKTSLDPRFHHINIDVYQGLREGRVTQSFIDEMSSKPMFEQLYLNKFPAEDSIDSQGYTPLFSEDFVKSRTRKSVSLFGEERLGCDVAGEGANYSVVVKRGKNGAKVLYREHNPDIMNFVGVILTLAQKHKIPSKKIFVDKVGIGKGVFDRLREIPEGKDVVGVMAGQAAQNSRDYFNKRAEMYFRMKDWLGTSELEGDGWFDLLDIKYKVQSDKKVKMKSKEEMLSDGVYSPDVADALSLTFYEGESPVVKAYEQPKYESPTLHDYSSSDDPKELRMDNDELRNLLE